MSDTAVVLLDCLKATGKIENQHADNNGVYTWWLFGTWRQRRNVDAPQEETMFSLLNQLRVTGVEMQSASWRAISYVQPVTIRFPVSAHKAAFSGL